MLMSHPMLVLLQLLWALPLTMLGLMVVSISQIFDSQQKTIWVHNRACTIVFVVYGNFLAELLRLHPWGAMQAMALGNCVIAQDAKAAKETFLHEMVHVQQAMQWGPLFPLVYVFASAWAFLRGGCPYRDNIFERAAYAAEETADKKHAL